MVEICKKCKGEGILNKEIGEPMDYFGTWREDGTAVVICDACDGKLVVDVIDVNKMLDSDEPSGQTKHTFDLSNVDEHQKQMRIKHQYERE